MVDTPSGKDRSALPSVGPAVSSLFPALSVPALTRYRLALTAIAFIIFIETVDSSIVPIALPSIANDFHTDYVLTQWVVLVSVLAQASLSLAVGWLGSVYGNKRILIMGLVLVATGNILCALAPTLGWLIGFRFVQGVGMIMIGALILAITTETFASGNRVQGFGFVGAMVSVGIVVGPLAGGVILEHLHWRMIFVFDLLLVGITFPLTIRYVQDRTGTGQDKFDFGGTTLFFASLLTFLLAASYDFGASAAWAVQALYVASGLSLLLFIWRESHTQHAVLDLRLFKDPRLSVYLTIRYVSFLVFGGIMLILPFYLEDLLDLNPGTVGVLFAIQPLCFGTASWYSGKLTQWLGPRSLILCALAILASGYYWMSFLPSELILWQFVAQMIILGLGMGLLSAPSSHLIFGSARPHNLSMLSSLAALARIHARSTGIAILGGLWVALTLARAPGNIADPVAMQAAQISSLGTVCLVSALILLTLLAFCLSETWMYLRRSQPDTPLLEFG